MIISFSSYSSFVSLKNPDSIIAEIEITNGASETFNTMEVSFSWLENTSWNKLRAMLHPTVRNAVRLLNIPMRFAASTSSSCLCFVDMVVSSTIPDTKVTIVNRTGTVFNTKDSNT